MFITKFYFISLNFASPPVTLAHEGYPGHHTEHSIKDHELVQTRGWLENSLTLINAPECVISEGIASTALDNVLTPAEQLDLFQHTIYPALGLKLDAARESEIDRAAEKIAAARTNAAFLLHDQKQTAAQVSAYLQRYGLLDEPLAAKAIEFQSHPLYRSYIFTYSIGKELLQQLFSARGTPDVWFGRLLTEPVTPAQIRNWIADPSTK